MLLRDKFRRRLCQSVALVLLVDGAAGAGWASNPETANPCPRQSTSHTISPSIGPSIRQSEDRDAAAVPGAHRTEENRPARKSVAADLCLAHFERSFLSDQKTIWTSPLHLRSQDKNWLVPFGAATLGLVAADGTIMRHFGNSPAAHSNSFGTYGLAAMVGSAASLYLRGITSHDDHSRETGFLAGEAATDSLLVGEAMKFAFRRPRPNEANAGGFGAGGASFPSEHALAAWSIASVIAHEYPGPLTKLLAYGAASGISLSRVAARQHFPSDVVVGSALGYLIGRYVYRAHHDQELPGASGNAFEKVFAEREPPHARTPAELGSPYVPLDSWVYAAFDRLAALGYAPSAFANLRPWTRMECARIIAGAVDDLGADENHQSEPYRLQAALQVEFSNELGRSNGSGTSEVRVDSIYTRYTGIAGTPLDDGYHFGQTLMNDYGRLYGQGSTLVG